MWLLLIEVSAMKCFTIEIRELESPCQYLYGSQLDDGVYLDHWRLVVVRGGTPYVFHNVEHLAKLIRERGAHS